MLAFGNSGIRQVRSFGEADKRSGCSRVLYCDVLSAPADTTVEWYRNGALIESSTVRALDALVEEKNQLGLGELSHRLCVDHLIGEGSGWIVRTEFRCKAKLNCDNHGEGIESEPLVLFSLGGHLPMRRRTERDIASKQQRQMAPIISLITNSRMELIGHPIQLMCKADGNPEPQIMWKVIAENGQEHPAGEYPFIAEIGNGDLLVDSAAIDRELASLSFRCRATNELGVDSADSTVILLKDEQ